MLDSFLDACEQINEGIANTKNPSNHAIWKKAVTSSELDFDWAKWIVLRIIYYDRIAKSVWPEDVEFKASFVRNKAVTKIKERYDCEDIFTAQLPNDILVPRPPKWGEVHGKPPKDNDAVGRPRRYRRPRVLKRKAAPDLLDDGEDEDQANRRHQPNENQVKKPPESVTEQAMVQATKDDLVTNDELKGILRNHLKKLNAHGYEVVKKDDRAYPPQVSQAKFDECTTVFTNAMGSYIRDKVKEATGIIKSENMSLGERMDELERTVKSLTSD